MSDPRVTSCPHPSYVASGIEEAIKLLKEGVKKP